MSTRTNNSLMITAAGLALGLGARWIFNHTGRYDLRGKVTLITGGSRGLGLLIARQLVDEGARVAICARDEEELRSARRELIERGGDILAIQCDVTDRDQVVETVGMVTEHFGRVDVLVNNAGVIQVGPMEDMEIEDYEEAMNIHFWAPLHTTLAVIPQMKERGEGRIINIASIGGKVSVPHLLPYSASKFALVGLSEGLRAELAKDGISVTTVCPGLMRTGSHGHAEVRGDHRDEFAWFSVAASFPGVSMSAERAAAQVVGAIRSGEAELVLSSPAKLLAKLHALYPAQMTDALGIINRLLPAATGSGVKKRGSQSRSEISPSILTSLGDKAAEKNNELVGSRA